MNKNTLLILAGLIVLFVIIGVFTTKDDAPKELAMAGNTFYPELLQKLNDVDVIEIKNNKEAITAKKNTDGQWGIQEKDGYMADENKLKSLLVASANMSIIEPKTKNPDLHNRLGLQDIDKSGSEAAQLSIKAKEQSMAEFLVGKIKASKDGKTVYIRKKGDNQSWLVKGDLAPPKFANDLLVKDITKIEDKRVSRVELNFPDKKTLSIYKENKGDTNYKVKNLGKKEEIDSTFNVNNIAYTLAKLNLQDVVKQEKVDFSKTPLFSAELETYDGLRIKAEAAEQDAKKYIALSAEFDENLVKVELPPEAKKPDSAKNKEDAEDPAKIKKEAEEKLEKLKAQTIEKAKKEVENLNKKWQGWAYSVSASNMGSINKRKKDLIKKPEKKAKPQK